MKKVRDCIHVRQAQFRQRDVYRLAILTEFARVMVST